MSGWALGQSAAMMGSMDPKIRDFEVTEDESPQDRTMPGPLHDGDGLFPGTLPVTRSGVDLLAHPGGRIHECVEIVGRRSVTPVW